MLNAHWVALLRRVPTALHNSLMLITTVGTEVAVQDIFRLDDEFMVLRGRMSGTTDNGRVFVIPYDQLHYVGFQKLLSPTELQAFLDPAIAAPIEPAPVIEQPTAATPAAEDKPAPEPPPQPAPVPPAQAPEQAPEPPSRVVLLQRVRARLAAAQAKAAQN
jgi:hypothetical protein